MNPTFLVGFSIFRGLMMVSGLYRTKVKGTGHYLPEKLLTNHDLEKLVDTNDAWIRERTGIWARHIAAEGQHTSDLALEAAKIALKEAELEASEIDAIIVGTASPDQPMPNTACMLQAKLGAPDCMAMDLSAACSGFVYSVTVADQFIKTGLYKNVLVVGAEVLHPIVDYKDRSTCILFGDGAGAFVLGRADEEEDSKVYSSHLRADGKLGELFVLPAGGSAVPLSQKVLDEGLQYVQMKGREIFKHAVRTMSLCCTEALKAADLPAEEVDWVIPHQANARIIEAVARHFGIPMSKVIVEIENMGNTSAATIPVAFDLAKNDGRIKRGQNILLTAFGAGITSGSVLLRY